MVGARAFCCASSVFYFPIELSGKGSEVRNIWAQETGEHCDAHVAVDIEKVSARSLPKTGVLREAARDFREILAEVATLRRPHSRAVAHKTPYFKGLFFEKLPTI